MPVVLMQCHVAQDAYAVPDRVLRAHPHFRHDMLTPAHTTSSCFTKACDAPVHGHHGNHC